MAVVDKAYGDSIVRTYHDDPAGNHGDGLARFIAGEIGETFDPELNDKDQITEAIRVMETARRQLSVVVSGLLYVLDNTL
jgi:hypothetical protein